MDALKLTCTALALICGFFGPAFAQTDKYNITPQEHAACDADVARLCSASYPDEDKVLECMSSHRDQLSPTCLASFKAGIRKRNLPL